MNVIFKTPDHIEIENVTFLETKKNIIMDGNFTKIIYSDHCVTMNGIFLNIPLYFASIEFNTLSFHNTNNNMMIIKTIGELEYKLLDYYKQFYGIYKPCIYNIHRHLSSGKIKLYREQQDMNTTTKKQKMKIVLKISGVWETVNEIGVTYKILEMYDI